MPPPGMPMPMMYWRDAFDRVGPSSQPELTQMVENGTIPPALVDARPPQELTVQWLAQANRLGAVRMR